MLGGALGATVAAFFVEAFWLERRALTERWLFVSLLLTLLVLGTGTALSGGLQSPLLPLLFAPAVVGFAAFARSLPSAFLLAVALLCLLAVAQIAPLPGFPAPPAPWLARMLLISAATSFALLAVGVIGLVDAHARIAAELDRMRTDMLAEAERRAQSIEHLGAHVAHEVKNPLTAVRGLVQLVQRKVQEPRDRERLDVVIAEVDRALEVLKDYLSFARPLTDLSLSEVDLRALLEDVAGVIEARAQAQGVRLGGRRRGPEARRGSPAAARRGAEPAMNAITAMPRGGRLELSLSAGADAVRIAVRDDGVGMSEERLAQLGAPFASDAAEGTGLGVLLARGVARQHGGELVFESAPGQGTCAMLVLPIAARPRGGALMAEILIVDDEPAVLFTLRELLEERGHRVRTAQSGAEARAHATTRSTRSTSCSPTSRCPAGRHAAARAARTRDCPSCRSCSSPRTAASASRSQAMKAGAYDYLPKPFDIDELAARDRARARGCGAAARGAQRPRRRARSAGRIIGQRARIARACSIARCGRRARRHGARARRDAAPARSSSPRCCTRAARRADAAARALQLRGHPDELAESELFGHARGAFTGAAGDHARLLRAARRRHAVPRRDRRAAAAPCRPSSCARCRRARSSRVGGGQHRAGRRARRRLRPTATSRPRSTAGTLPRGPLLPARRGRARACRRCASGARTSRCSPRSSRALRRALRPRGREPLTGAAAGAAAAQLPGERARAGEPDDRGWSR